MHIVIIAGGRNFNDFEHVQRIMQRLFPVPHNQIDYIISGNARGADRLGERWSWTHAVPVMLMPANWGRHGRSAGPIRNSAMAKRGTYLLAFWDGKSKGTKNMIETAGREELEIHVETYE